MFFKIMGILACLFMGNNQQQKVDLFQISPSEVNKSVQFATKASAELIVNNYERDDVFVADIIVDKEHGYNVDPTGETPSTMELARAIDDCANLGGGTVYLPHGKYLITSRIEIKPYVNLRGDYRNPDNVTDGDYGTLILAGVSSSEEDVNINSNIFRMAGSSAIIGLTFFYPMQYMDSVMPYSYTIEIPGGFDTNHHNVFTIKDVTFLNSYKGICASITKSGVANSITHEQLHLENIKGTVLREGVHLTNSSEVGAFNDIVFSSKYWANAGDLYNAPNYRNIVDFTSKNSVGMILGDLEWQEIENIIIEDYHTGIYFHDKTRLTDYAMSFIGSLYNIEILRSTYGIYVEQLYPNLGIEIANSTIQGSEYAFINNSPKNEGHIKLSGVSLNGAVGGVNVYYDNHINGELPTLEKAKLVYNLPKLELYNVLNYGIVNTGLVDASQVIQEALNDAHENGGGIVYLPAGFYRLVNPITVYENTLLKGCTSAVQKDLTKNSLGTLLISYYGKNNVSGDALITLSGDNAGVSCLRIVYPELNLFEKVYTKETLPSYAYTIRGNGDGVYATNLYLTGVYNGIDFSNNCNDYLIRRVMGVFYNTGFFIGGNNGVVDTCLSNGIAVTKVGTSLINDFDAWRFDENNLSNVLATYVYPLTRESTHFIRMENATNAKIHNLFTFASNSLIDATNSDFEGLNLGLDSQPSNSGNMFNLIDSDALVYNTLRDSLGTHGTFMTLTGDSKITLFNRMTLLPGDGSRLEKNIMENQEVALALMEGQATTINKIWEQTIEYEFIEYPDSPGGDDSNSNSSNSSSTDPVVPPENSKLAMYIGIGIGASVLVITIIIYLIIKFRR